MPNTLVVMDFETVPDEHQLPHLFPDFDPEKQTVDEFLKAKYPNGDNFFVPASMQKIVTVATLICDIQSAQGVEAYNARCLKSSDEHEQVVLSKLVSWMEKNPPRLVTFNGRAFELPVLRYRCMHHMVPCRFLYVTGDKWDNYDSRYNHSWHCDIMDALCTYGASKSPKLREAAAAVKLPGKIFGNGKDVYKQVRAGQLQEVRDYCEMDVVETFVLYLKWQHLKGVVTNDGYWSSIWSLLKLLKGHGKETSRLFLDEWQRLDYGIQFYLEKMAEGKSLEDGKS